MSFVPLDLIIRAPFAGVVVAIFLIGQQTGVFMFLTSLMTSLIDNSQADVWVTNESVVDGNRLGTVDMRFERQLLSVAGVERLSPLVLAGASSKLSNGEISPVQLIGTQAPGFLIEPWNIIEGRTTELLTDKAVSADVLDFPDIEAPGERMEINGQTAYVQVLTRGSRGFGGIYLITTENRARQYGRFPIDRASAFLLKTEKGVAPDSVVSRINRSFSGVRAWTREDLSAQTRDYTLNNSGIGRSTGTLIIFAVIAGLIIIGLTLFSAAIERLNDYATMKAIGATNNYISRLLLLQAFLAATTGFVLAALCLVGFQQGIAQAGVLFSYTWQQWAIFYAATLFISLGGALMAIFRSRKVEPASVFR